MPGSILSEQHAALQLWLLVSSRQSCSVVLTAHRKDLAVMPDNNEPPNPNSLRRPSPLSPEHLFAIGRRAEAPAQVLRLAQLIFENEEQSIWVSFWINNENRVIWVTEHGRDSSLELNQMIEQCRERMTAFSPTRVVLVKNQPPPQLTSDLDDVLVALALQAWAVTQGTIVQGFLLNPDKGEAISLM